MDIRGRIISNWKSEEFTILKHLVNNDIKKYFESKIKHLFIQVLIAVDMCVFHITNIVGVFI